MSDEQKVIEKKPHRSDACACSILKISTFRFLLAALLFISIATGVFFIVQKEEPESESPLVLSPLSKEASLVAHEKDRVSAFPEPNVLIAEWQKKESLSPELLAAFTARRESMMRLIREDPETALAFALTPHEYASLPPELQALTERPIVGVGFYGVLAVCNHDSASGHSSACHIKHHIFVNDREIPVTIYGSRRDRLTEEDASLYGVELDGVLALHSDDAVVFPGERMSDDPTHIGQFALLYRGQTYFFPDGDSLQKYLSQIAKP